ncbi:MAG TPA: OsmC family protein [Ktedonosporobacter sp.]|nr:OsmC family protein [Ktedonosporobacter sp.]
MAKEATVRAQLATGMRFDVETGSGHKIVLDTAKDDDGQDAGPRPMEMLLVGLAGCAGIDIISMLRKMRQSVIAYEIRVHGIRADEHPRVYTQITVEHIITGQNVQPDTVQRAIKLSEERYCSVNAMLDKTAAITHTFQVIEG